METIIALVKIPYYSAMYLFYMARGKYQMWQLNRLFNNLIATEAK